MHLVACWAIDESRQHREIGQQSIAKTLNLEVRPPGMYVASSPPHPLKPPSHCSRPAVACRLLAGQAHCKSRGYTYLAPVRIILYAWSCGARSQTHATHAFVGFTIVAPAAAAVAAVDGGGLTVIKVQPSQVCRLAIYGCCNNALCPPIMSPERCWAGVLVNHTPGPPSVTIIGTGSVIVCTIVAPAGVTLAARQSGGGHTVVPSVGCRSCRYKQQAHMAGNLLHADVGIRRPASEMLSDKTLIVQHGRSLNLLTI